MATRGLKSAVRISGDPDHQADEDQVRVSYAWGKLEQAGHGHIEASSNLAHGITRLHDIRGYLLRH